MIPRVSLVENKPALLGTYSEDLLVKSKEARTVKMRVPAVYLKITDKTQQNVVDSFSEGVPDSVYTIEPVACGI